jgi:hypothetical protein
MDLDFALAASRTDESWTDAPTSYFPALKLEDVDDEETEDDVDDIIFLGEFAELLCDLGGGG